MPGVATLRVAAGFAAGGCLAMRILAVDDDVQSLEYLAGVLRPEHDVTAFPSGEQAILELRRTRFDLVVADLNMPPPDGFEVLRAAQVMASPPPVIVITALDTAKSTLEALRLGARDYLVKPAAPEAIRCAVSRIATLTGVAPSDSGGDFGLVGQSPTIRQIRTLIPLLSRSGEIVLIQGETGTGKELLARAIHEYGPRSAGPFVAHNMAATPAELTESLFFGHARGSFSGAAADHAGLFEQASDGTLFLDEIDSFPLALQAKLLRILESGRIQRIGSALERPVNARVIAASAADPGELVARGAFRADLYYRLRQLEIQIPPLRERCEDIPRLTRHFLDEISAQMGTALQVSPAAMSLLAEHAWPGNCRELRNAVRSAALIARGGTILPGHLPRALKHELAAPGAGPGALRRFERDHILEALERTGGNRSRAARMLGIDRGTLARKLKMLGTEIRSRMK